LSFALFLLVNAMLFVRPAELHPSLYGLPVYEVCILACLASSYPTVAARLRPADLAARPVNACAAGMLAAIVLADLANLDPPHAAEDGVEFLKLLLYYFLLVSVVDTPRRLARLLGWLGVYAAVITVMAVLRFHGLTDFPAIEFLKDTLDDSGREESMFRRLGATGVFLDPNDMCLMLVMAINICLYQLIERRRAYWAVPLGLFGYAMMLTHSRGGFLGLLAGVVTLLLVRFGRRAVPLGLLVLPAVFALFAGRQTSISLSSGTGQTRVQLWLEGVNLFVHHPVFGVGSNRYQEYAGHVAHNSFINTYTELGFVGGTVFLSAFYLAGWPLVRLGGRGVPALSPELRAMRPYVLAVVAGYAGGLMSLSNAYIIPTYTVLGLAAVFVRLAEEDLGVPVARLNGPLALRLAALSVGAVVVIQVGVRVLARTGG
jgi:putative inorganic carbon (HCO3(-)) transporter